MAHSAGGGEAFSPSAFSTTEEKGRDLPDLPAVTFRRCQYILGQQREAKTYTYGALAAWSLIGSPSATS